MSHPLSVRSARSVRFGVLVVSLAASGCGTDPARAPEGFLRFPERRARCAEHSETRNAYFGDLHVHTRLSFDAANADVRSGPDDAYRFAKGEPIGLPPYDANGNPTRTVQLRKPLDFLGVTDHSEFLAETSICLDETAVGYDTETCIAYRNDMRAQTGQVGDFFLTLIGQPPERRPICADVNAPGCQARLEQLWEEVARTAERHDDRSADCTFSTFIGYEWTGSIQGNNWHRNVIFGTSTVPSFPTSVVEAWTPERLWDALHTTCLDRGVGCDVLTIPHNLNISGGYMFRLTDDEGAPQTAAYAARRQALEPLVELYQHKGASECTPADSPLGSADEECRFELLVPDVCVGPDDPPGCRPICGPNAGGGFLGFCVTPNDFARPALRQGLAEWARLGVNPFAFGFIGSTDTHNATPGFVEEDDFEGHVGLQDADRLRRVRNPRGQLIVSRYSSPGGLAGVWAEENSRPSLFAAMRRREAFATSGPRIVVRFFAGDDLAADACARADLPAHGYASGVPMGGDLPAGTSAPRFVVQVAADPDGSPLEAVEIVKGWSDGTSTHEAVFLVAGDPNSTATVDPVTCTQSGSGGASSLCATWVDPTFDPTQPAFYYVRAREVPSCRWHRYVCSQLALDCSTIAPEDDGYACCDPSDTGTVRERAWSSPIWSYPRAP